MHTYGVIVCLSANERRTEGWWEERAKSEIVKCHRACGVHGKTLDIQSRSFTYNTGRPAVSDLVGDNCEIIIFSDPLFCRHHGF